MNENLIAPEQRTDGWYQDRSGKFTGSRFATILPWNAVSGKEPLKAYWDTVDQIVVDRLTGSYVDKGIDSKSLRWGREVEPFARDAHQFETGDIVTESGFINHKIYPFVGVSPDGLVKPDGGIEIKCPISEIIHLSRFTNGIEDIYMPQVQGCIWVCEVDWWDWISFHPRFTGKNRHLQMYRQRIYRNDAYIKSLEKAILIAEATVRERIESFSKENIEKLMGDKHANICN